MSASNLQMRSIASRTNSDELSRRLDSRAKLENCVRLSLCSNNPMMHVAKKEGRISDPVLLRIKLEVVSRPGVLFADRNAVRRGALISKSPENIRFDIVRAESAFAIPLQLRHFYQAEVLIPSPLPPHLIIFPSEAKADIGKAPRPLLYQPATSPLSLTSYSATCPSSDLPSLSSTAPVRVHITTNAYSNTTNVLSDANAVMLKAARFNPSPLLCVTHGAASPSCKPQPQEVTDEILAVWDLLNNAYIKALRANDLQEMIDILDYYPPLPCRPPLCPRYPLDTETVPPPSTCEYQVGPLEPSCRECIPGLYVCPNHESLCGGSPWIQCAACNRCVCWTHLDCFCAASQCARGPPPE